jgi:hypothetical protein
LIRQNIGLGKDLNHLSSQVLQLLIFGKLLWYRVEESILSKIVFNYTLPASQLGCVQTKGIHVDGPSFVSLFRVAGLATREKISKSVAKPAEPLVLDRGVHMVPRFGSRSTINANQVGLRILPQLAHRVACFLFIVRITRRDRRREGMIHSGRTVGDD